MMEKWEDRKDFILFFLFGYEWKSGGVKKMNLNKFTYIFLLKNDAKFFLKK